MTAKSDTPPATRPGATHTGATTRHTQRMRREAANRVRDTLDCVSEVMDMVLHDYDSIGEWIASRISEPLCPAATRTAAAMRGVGDALIGDAQMVLRLIMGMLPAKGRRFTPETNYTRSVPRDHEPVIRAWLESIQPMLEPVMISFGDHYACPSRFFNVTVWWSDSLSPSPTLRVYPKNGAPGRTREDHVGL